MAVDPARCVTGGDADAVLDHAEQLFAKILEQDGARLPSDRRFAARLRTPTEGIRIPRALHDTIREMAGG
jgi:LDH2 family malate/lactate/ureidoglycolate dehydrogenase